MHLQRKGLYVEGYPQAISAASVGPQVLKGSFASGFINQPDGQIVDLPGVTESCHEGGVGFGALCGQQSEVCLLRVCEYLLLLCSCWCYLIVIIFQPQTSQNTYTLTQQP